MKIGNSIRRNFTWTHTRIILMSLVISMEKLIREKNQFIVLTIWQKSMHRIRSWCTEGNLKNAMKDTVNFPSRLVKFTLYQEPFFCNRSHKLQEGRAIAPPPEKSIYYYKKKIERGRVSV